MPLGSDFIRYKLAGMNVLFWFVFFFPLFVHLGESQFYYFSLEVVKGCKYYELRLSVVSSKTTVVPNLHIAV